jgi:hypothetical protein
MFLFAVKETLCCGAKSMTASFHDPMKATDAVQVDLECYTLGASAQIKKVEK